MIEKQCAYCGNTFTAFGKNAKITKYCSKKCATKNHDEKKKQRELAERRIFIRNDTALDDCVREAQRLGMTYGKYIAWRDRAIYGEGLQHEHIHSASMHTGLPPQEGRLCGNVPGMAGL